LSSHVTPVRFHADPAPPPPPPAAASAGGASILFGALRRSSMALVEASTSRSKYDVVEPSARFL